MRKTPLQCHAETGLLGQLIRQIRPCGKHLIAARKKLTNRRNRSKPGTLSKGIDPMTDAEQIAAFIAKRGITQIPAGGGTLTHLTTRDWRKVVRGEMPATIDPTTRRIVHEDGKGREYVTNGLGELIYVDEGFGR